MTSSSTPDSQPARPELELGIVLRHTRNAKQRSVAQVARVLILSVAQINGLESGSLAAFHNRTYYLRALTKYLDYLGVAKQAATVSLLAQLEQQAAVNNEATSQKELNLLLGSVLHPSRKTLLIPNKRLPLLLVTLAVLVGIGLVAFTLLQRLPQADSVAVSSAITESALNTSQSNQRLSETAPAPDPATSPTQPPKAEQTTPDVATNPGLASKAATTPTQPLSSSGAAHAVANAAAQTKILRLSFTAPAWVQMIAQDGKRVEKVFTPEETLDVDPATTVSVVVGNAREASFSAGQIKIDLAQFIKPNSSVARLNQQDLNALVTP